MNTLVLSVLGIALVDSINPSALVTTFYLLTQRAFTSKVLVYVAAIFITYLTLGLLLMFGLDALLVAFEEQLTGPTARVVQSAAGALMLAYALFAPQRSQAKQEARTPRGQNLLAIFGLGVTVTLIESSTALPYLSATAIMTGADLLVSQWLPILVLYNLIFIAPPLLLLLAYRFSGPRLRTRLDAWREGLQRGGRATLRWLVGLIGFFFLTEGLGYFGFLG